MVPAERLHRLGPCSIPIDLDAGMSSETSHLTRGWTKPSAYPYGLQADGALGMVHPSPDHLMLMLYRR